MPPKFSEEINLLFRPRPKPRFLEPIEIPSPRPLTPTMSLMKFILKNELEKPEGEAPLANNEAKIQRRRSKIEENDKKIEEMKKKYDPFNDPKVTKNPKNTLFISNLPPHITEERIHMELSPFGRIKQIHLIRRTGKIKSYCFVEYEDHNGAVNAYNHRSQQIVDGYSLLIDFEKARTVPNWLPQRLGGGEGAESREFNLSRKAIEFLTPHKKKKSTWKSGKRYNLVLDDVRRKREERYGRPPSKQRGRDQRYRR